MCGVWGGWGVEGLDGAWVVGWVGVVGVGRRGWCPTRELHRCMRTQPCGSPKPTSLVPAESVCVDQELTGPCEARRRATEGVQVSRWVHRGDVPERNRGFHRTGTRRMPTIAR